jgi:hypothetical protein
MIKLKDMITEESNYATAPVWAKQLMVFLTNAYSVRGRTDVRAIYTEELGVSWTSNVSDMKSGIANASSGQDTNNPKKFDMKWEFRSSESKNFAQQNITMSEVKKIIKFYNKS